MVCFWFQNNEIEKFVWLRMKIINRKFAVSMYSECRLCILVSCVSLLFVLGRRFSSVIPVTDDGSIVPAILVSQRFISLVINFFKSFLDIMFFFPHSCSGEGLGATRKKKPVISNTGRFFCFNSTVSYTCRHPIIKTDTSYGQEMTLIGNPVKRSKTYWRKMLNPKGFRNRWFYKIFKKELIKKILKSYLKIPS